VRIPVVSSEASGVIERYLRAKSLRELQDAVRDHSGGDPGARVSATKIRLAITGNYSTQFLAKGFPLALAARSIDAEVYESAYNQWQLELIDPASPLYAFSPTHILVALTSIELAYSSGRTVDEAVTGIAAAVDAAMRSSSAHVFVTLPEPLVDEITDQSGAYVWRSLVIQGVRERLASLRVSLIDMDPLVRTIGSDRWFDDRFYDVAKLPFHPDATPRVLARLADAVAGVVRVGCKLVIVDLDDTLWGGRVGEDGWGGIELGAAGKGRHFLRLQSFLQSARAKGTVLAIASKNDLGAVKEVFNKRAEMMLRLDDFAAAEIHWEPKSVSVGRILSRLNLSTAGVMFIDDNPIERAEVAARYPDLAIPELPEDPAHRVPLLISTGLFDRRVVTGESALRHKMYAENEQREQALKDAGNIDEFLTRLEMVLEASSPQQSRERTLELIQKTNQFNLTTRRYNWEELAAVAREGFAVCYRLKDKFGDNGIISVVVVKAESAAAARIELWLMSCRVLGRKVEEAILCDVAERAQAKGLRMLVGEYRPTGKNGMVSELYPRLGFKEVSRGPDAVSYELPLDAEVAGVSFIRKLDKVVDACLD
jgi:FkbH-like protein